MTKVMEIADGMMGLKSVPCTACHYCVSHCPQGIDIPRMIELYNEHLLTAAYGGMTFIAPMAMAVVPEDQQPSACLHCRSCEQVCPQQIEISEVMTDFVEKIR
jgi:predicted aldo/keto reductase-like oxidoreductase